jgi:hypothetical protein
MRQYIVFLFVSCLVFTSCEDVINLNLDTTSAQIVVQANIYDQPGPYAVKLSQTVDFDKTSIYPPVSGAFVMISDNHGNTDTLTENTFGTYITSKLIGTPGYTYTLTIITGAKTYTAVSTIAEAVSIDSIYIEESDFTDQNQVGIKFKDPAIIKNYYRIVQFVNNEQKNVFYTISDELYDGKEIKYSIMPMETSNNDEKLKTGDLVTVWLESVDKGVYDYFRTAGGDMTQSASPENPLSNISNGALGYFNACAVRTALIEVPYN